MQLTQDQLEVARGHLRNKDFEAFRAWMQENRVCIDHDLVVRTMKQVASVDPEKALQLFDASFTGMNPTSDRVVSLLKVFAVLCVIAFVIAVFLHLVSVWFGS